MRIDDAGNSIQAGLAWGERIFLCDVADTQSSPRDELPFIRLFQAREDAKQSGFTRAISSNQADTFTFGQTEGDASKEQARAIGFCEISSGQKHERCRLTDLQAMWEWMEQVRLDQLS